VKISAAKLGKGKSKAKSKDPQAEEVPLELSNDENNVEEHTVEICMYVNVETAPPSTLHVGGHATKAPAIKITPRGPFTFTSNTSYTNFLTIIAKGVIAGITDCLVRAGMQW